MKRAINLLMWIIVCAVTAMAENYPYRSDLLWITLPDHADWLYRTGEDAKVDVQVLRYGVPLAGEVVSYELSTDMLEPDSKGEIRLDGHGRGKIDVGTMKEPGFRDCAMKIEVDGKTSRHHVKVGYSPERLEAFTQMPSDFMEFWGNARASLQKLPLKYTVEPMPSLSSDMFECSLVKLEVSRQGQVIYGYLFVPSEAAPGSCPVVVSPPGAGIKTIRDPLRHRYYPENGFIRFEMEIHGLDPRMTDEQFGEISKAFGGKENGYLVNGLDNRDNYYMKRVYLSLTRAVDFLTSLPQWDGRNVIMQGGSQGGALAIVGAALDERVTACVANHPALSDMARYSVGKTGGYPHLHREGMLTPEKIETLRYYDVVNFARMLRVPVLLTWGYNDNTCPPTTSYIVYNEIKAPKESLITPVNEHWTSDDTERKLMDWIKKSLR